MKYVSYVFAFILFIVVAIFGARILRSQINNINKQTVVTEQVDLAEYKKIGSKLKLIVKGPVVADENHQELLFEIGQGTRTVKLLKGYNGAVEREMALGNNFNAYESFAAALYSAGFTKLRDGFKDTKYLEQCPNGNLYTTELITGTGEAKSSLWRASCSTKIGNLKASYSTILELFKDQFPEYNKFSSDISID